MNYMYFTKNDHTYISLLCCGTVYTVEVEPRYIQHSVPFNIRVQMIFDESLTTLNSLGTDAKTTKFGCN